MAGVEAPDVVHHRHQARFPLHLHEPLGIGERVRYRYLDQHVLAGAHRLLGLAGVHLGRRGEDGRLDSRARQALGEIRRPVGNAVLAGRCLRVLGDAARDGDDLDALDARKRIQMLVGEGALSDHADLHESIPPRSSSTISP